MNASESETSHTRVTGAGAPCSPGMGVGPAIGWSPANDALQESAHVGETYVIRCRTDAQWVVSAHTRDDSWSASTTYFQHEPTDAEVRAWVAIVERHAVLMRAEMAALVGGG